MALFPLGITVELLINGTWTDVSAYVMQRDLIQITGGRTARSDTAQPAQVTLTFRNNDGRFSPNNASGPYFPYLKRNVQLRVSINDTSSSGNVYSGFRGWFEVAAWPPQSDISGSDVFVQVTANGPLRRIRKGGGKGSALTRYYASLTGGLAPVAYWPCEEDPDTTIIGAGIDGGTDMAVTAGTPKWKAGAGFNGSAPVGVLNNSTWDGLTGQYSTSGDDIFAAPGTYTWISPVSSVNAIVTGAGGGGAQGPGPGTAAAGGGGERAQETALAVTPGQPYTIVVGAGGTGGAGDYSGLHTGSAGASSSIAGDAVTVTAHGGQGGSLSAGGAGGTGSTNTVTHPGGAGGKQTGGNAGAGGGGGSGGTSATGNAGASTSSNTHGAGAAAVSGGGHGGDGGDGGFGSPPASGGAAGGIPGGGGGAGGTNLQSGFLRAGGNGASGRAELVYTPAVTPSNNVVRFLMQTPSWGGNQGKVLLRVLTSGTVGCLEVQFSSTARKLVLKGFSAVGGSLLFTGNLSTDIASGGTSPGLGPPWMVSAELSASGANVGWRLAIVKPGGTADFDSVTGTQTTATMGNVTEVIAGPNADITKTAVGHISVQYAFQGLTRVSNALGGHNGEMGIDRFVRLAGEQVLDNATEFNETNDHWGFETGTQGWTGNNASVTQSNAWSSEGAVKALPTGAFLNEAGMGAADLNGAAALWNSWTGLPLKTVRMYLGASSFTYGTDLSQAVSAGLKVCLTLRPAFNPTSGTDLANMTTLLQTMQAAGAKAEITLWHEPFFAGLTSAQYIAMVNFYGPTVRQYFPLVFCTSASSVQSNNENSFYPGDGAVDKIATDLYAFSWTSGGGSTRLDLAASIADSAVPPKPFGLWEFGSSFGTDFLTGQNTNFDGGTGTWLGAGNCTTSASASPVRNGSGAMKMTSVASGDMSAAHCSAANILTQGLACSPGDLISCGAWLRAAVSARSVSVGATFYTSGGVIIGGSPSGPAVTDSTSGWTFASGVELLAPATAAFCRLTVKVAATGAAAEVHSVDDAYIANTTTAGQTQAQATAFFSYVQSYFSWRARNGRVNADLLYFNSGLPATNITSLVSSAADYRLPLLNAITTGTGAGQSLKVTASGGAGLWSADGPSGTSGQPVNPKDVVSAACDIYTPASLGALRITVRFYDVSGTFLSSVSGFSTSTGAGTTMTLTVGASDGCIAPAGAAFFNVRVADNETVTAGTIFYVDHVRVHPQMGVQTKKEYHQFLEEIEDLDQGIMKEAKELWGLKYRTRIRMINQAVAVTLTYAMLSPPLQPVLDDKFTKNDITVKRRKGSKVRVTFSSGTMSVLEPPAGTGRYRKRLEVVAKADEQLLALAAHLLALGTAADERYPQIHINMARCGIAGNALAPLMSAIASVEVGDRINVSGLPAWMPSSSIDALVIGYTETIGPFSWDITWNTIPFSPLIQASTSLRRW